MLIERNRLTLVAFLIRIPVAFATEKVGNTFNTHFSTFLSENSQYTASELLEFFRNFDWNFQA